MSRAGSPDRNPGVTQRQCLSQSEGDLGKTVLNAKQEPCEHPRLRSRGVVMREGGQNKHAHVELRQPRSVFPSLPCPRKARACVDARPVALVRRHPLVCLADILHGENRCDFGSVHGNGHWLAKRSLKNLSEGVLCLDSGHGLHHPAPASTFITDNPTTPRFIDGCFGVLCSPGSVRAA